MPLRPELVACATALGLLSACTTDPTSGYTITKDVNQVLISGVENTAAPITATVKLEDFQRSIRDAAINGAVFKGAKAAVSAAEASVDRANSAFAPQVNLQSQIGALSERYSSRTDNTSGVSANLSVDRLISDGGATTATVKAAIAQVIAAEAEGAATLTGIVSDMATAWIDLWQFQQRIALLASRTEEGRAIVRQMDRLVASGMVDKSSVASAKILIHDLDIEELRLKELADEASARLAKHFKVDGATISRPAPIITQLSDKQAKQAWADNPSLRSAAAGIVVAQQEVNIAAAQKKPKVGVRAGLNSPMSDSGSTDLALGVQVSWALSDGGRRDADIKAKEATLEAAQKRLDTEKRETAAVITQLRASRASLVSGQSSLRAKAGEVTGSLETLKKQLSTGQADLKRVVDAEIQALRTADRAIEIEAEIMKLDVAIAARSGRLLSSFGIAAPTSTLTKATDK